jgi:hypothetical protein
MQLGLFYPVSLCEGDLLFESQGEVWKSFEDLQEQLFELTVCVTSYSPV